MVAILIGVYMFAFGWNVHNQATTPREPMVKQEVKRND